MKATLIISSIVLLISYGASGLYIPQVDPEPEGEAYGEAEELPILPVQDQLPQGEVISLVQVPSDPSLEGKPIIEGGEASLEEQRPSVIDGVAPSIILSVPGGPSIESNPIFVVGDAIVEEQETSVVINPVDPTLEETLNDASVKEQQPSLIENPVVSVDDDVSLVQQPFLNPIPIMDGAAETSVEAQQPSIIPKPTETSLEIIFEDEDAKIEQEEPFLDIIQGDEN